MGREVECSAAIQREAQLHQELLAQQAEQSAMDQREQYQAEAYASQHSAQQSACAPLSRAQEEWHREERVHEERQQAPVLLCIVEFLQSASHIGKGR